MVILNTTTNVNTFLLTSSTMGSTATNAHKNKKEKYSDTHEGIEEYLIQKKFKCLFFYEISTFCVVNGSLHSAWLDGGT